MTPTPPCLRAASALSDTTETQGTPAGLARTGAGLLVDGKTADKGQCGTSEVLIRPSWKEQVVGSWVHRFRYLHQWQRKALFTQDRHLGGKQGLAQGSAPRQGCSHLQALPEIQASWENHFFFAGGGFDIAKSKEEVWESTHAQKAYWGQPHNLFHRKMQAGIYCMMLDWCKIEQGVAQAPGLGFSS